MSFQKVEVDYDVDVDLASLFQMIIYRRPARSEGEIEMINNYIDIIPNIQVDEHGNRYVRIGTAPVLWSSHTDTVHRNEKAGKYQRIAFENGIISLNNKASTCLGADCTAGIWIMKEMIRAGVEGLYIFHRDEEVGGYGSSFIAKKTPELLDGILYAIAFDRKGNDSVITHQFSQRCASNAFVTSILPMLPPGYCADSGGTFTDTANYTEIISECTNLSVGYENAHTSTEFLNVRDLLYLRNAMIKFDYTKLVAERDVTEIEYDRSYYSYGGHGGSYSGPGWDWDEEDDDIPFRRKANGNVLTTSVWTNKPKSNEKFFDLKDHFGVDGEEIDYPGNCRSIRDFLVMFPDESSDYLEQQGYSLEDFFAHAPWLDN